MLRERQADLLEQQVRVQRGQLLQQVARQLHLGRLRHVREQVLQVLVLPVLAKPLQAVLAPQELQEQREQLADQVQAQDVAAGSSTTQISQPV